MKESELAMSRRRFILSSAKVATGVALASVIAPEILDALDRLTPRRVMVPGVQTYPILNHWYEARFQLTDENVRELLDKGIPPMQAVEARKALADAFAPLPLPSVRCTITRQYNQEVFSLDALGQNPKRRLYSLKPQPSSLAVLPSYTYDLGDVGKATDYGVKFSAALLKAIA